MKRLASCVAMLGIVMACACTSKNDGGSAPDASVQDASTDPCAYWTHSGDTCPLPTKQGCFRECLVGGCFCKREADGVLRWSCVTDTSCVPDSGPLDETGPPDAQGDDDDAGDDDASGDASSGDASDAG